MDQSFPDTSPACSAHRGGYYGVSVACLECRRTIKVWILEQIPRLPAFEAVGFTGSSGSAFGYWLADELQVQPLHVLKSGEHAHGGEEVRGKNYGLDWRKSWLFLDDFQDTGSTQKRVARKIGSEPVASMLWLPSYHTTQRLHEGKTIARYDGKTYLFEGRKPEAILAPECPLSLLESSPQLLSPSLQVSDTPFPSMRDLLELPRPTYSELSFTSGLETLALGNYQIKPIEFELSDFGSELKHEESF